MRYIILILLNIPIISLALFNIVIQYKMKKVTKQRFHQQFALWLVLLVLLVSSFPLYNLSVGKSLFDSAELSLFDIAQTTAVIVIIYILNGQRRKIERAEKTIRDLHQELSIRLSQKD